MYKYIKRLKYLLWRTARRIGLDVYPLDYRNSVQTYLAHIFDTKGIDCIWDIGANTGQYATMLRNIGFKGEIISFEPIPVVWEELKRNSAADPNWNVYPRCAVGIEEGNAFLNVTADSVSSSLLNPIDASAVVNSVSVKVERLDSIIGKVKPSLACLLKLDCQGGEHGIIQSAGIDIRQFLYVQMEASIYPLYEEEPTFFELIELMRLRGFDIAFIYPGIIDGYDRMVQAELFFKRR